MGTTAERAPDTRRQRWRRRLLGRAVSQFGNPRGGGGWLAGQVMRRRSSNRRRNEWAVALLDIQPTDRVLEVGFGPGIALRAASRRATSGRVDGVDHSVLMVRQAGRLNRAAVRAGRVVLHQGSVEDVTRLLAADDPAAIGSVDKILTVNSVPFWPEPTSRLRELRGLLRVGGTIAVAVQPRTPGADAETSRRAAEDIRSRLTEAGYSDIRVETLDLTPPVVCVLAVAGPAS